MTAKERRKRVQQEQARINREVSEMRRRAGLTNHAGKSDTTSEIEWRRQIELMPADTRGLTAYLMGDPIKGDPRAPWRG